MNPSRTAEIGPGYICPCCTEAYPKKCFKEVLNRHDAEKLVKEIRKNLNDYLEAAGKKGLDDQGGSLGSIAAQVAMQVFYGARVARPDLLRAIGRLSRYLTKWSTQCDERLHQLMCYLNSSLDHHSIGWLGNEMEDIRLQ